MAIRKYGHSVVRGTILLHSSIVVVDFISFLSQILVGDIGPRSIRTWPPRFVPDHSILQPARLHLPCILVSTATPPTVVLFVVG